MTTVTEESLPSSDRSGWGSAEWLGRLFLEARSFNGYLDHSVSVDQLREIWDLAKMGPTSANQSPARIVWCVSAEAKMRLANHASKTNASKILNAPVSAIVGMDLDFPNTLPRLFPHVDARPWFAGNEALVENSAFRNSSLQGAYLIMAARAVGLDVGPMSGFDNAAVDADFFSATHVRSNFIFTLGYGDSSTIFPRLPRLGFEEANIVL